MSRVVNALAAAKHLDTAKIAPDMAVVIRTANLLDGVSTSSRGRKVTFTRGSNRNIQKGSGEFGVHHQPGGRY